MISLPPSLSLSLSFLFYSLSLFYEPFAPAAIILYIDPILPSPQLEDDKNGRWMGDSREERDLRLTLYRSSLELLWNFALVQVSEEVTREYGVEYRRRCVYE